MFVLWFYVSLSYVLECPLGYYLNKCSKKCSPPNYGEECQSVCQCPNKDCHFASGCPQHMETVTVYQRLSIIFKSYLKCYLFSCIFFDALKTKIC